MTFRCSAFLRGFTLIELLIALSVTALVVSVLFSAMGLLGRTEKSGLIAVTRANHMLEIDRWLQAKIDSMRMLSKEHDGKIEIFFNGNPAGAVWITPMPELGEGGGLHVIRITPLRLERRTDWIVEMLPYSGGKTLLDWSRAEKETLLKGVTTLQWYYQDGVSGVWLREWNGDKKYYPSRIKINVGDENGEWPGLIYSFPRMH